MADLAPGSTTARSSGFLAVVRGDATDERDAEAPPPASAEWLPAERSGSMIDANAGSAVGACWANRSQNSVTSWGSNWVPA